MSTTEFLLEGIPIQVTKKRVKYLRLKIMPTDAKVYVSAPFRMSFKAIVDFIQSKLDWIKKHQIQQSYMDDSRIEFLGKKCDLKIEDVDAWYKPQLKLILQELVEKWEKVIQVKVHHVSIRKMKTRWGSCSYKTGRIRFNLELAKKALEAIEYVVVHEMVHLLEPSHNHRFKALMDQFMPDWRLHRRTLNQKKDCA